MSSVTIGTFVIAVGFAMGAPALAASQVLVPPPGGTGVDIGADLSNVAVDGYSAAELGTFSVTAWRAGAHSTFWGDASGSRFETGHTLLYGVAHGATDLMVQPWRTTISAEGGGGAYRGQASSGYGLISLAATHEIAGMSHLWTAGAVGRAGGATPHGTAHVAAGVMLVHEATTLSGDVKIAHVRDGYADGNLRLAWRGSTPTASRSQSFTLTAEVGARARGDDQHPVWASIGANLPLGARAGLVVGYGVSPEDPERATLGSRALTAGIRVAFGRSSSFTTVALPLGPSIRVVHTDGANGHAIIIRVPNATTIEVMGDFTGWTAVAMTRVSSTEWRGEFFMAPGVHRANIRINNGAWDALPGAPTIADDFGGTTSVLVIP